jgi:hypothetical protein
VSTPRMYPQGHSEPYDCVSEAECSEVPLLPAFHRRRLESHDPRAESLKARSLFRNARLCRGGVACKWELEVTISNLEGVTPRQVRQKRFKKYSLISVRRVLRLSTTRSVQAGACALACTWSTVTLLSRRSCSKPPEKLVSSSRPRLVQNLAYATGLHLAEYQHKPPYRDFVAAHDNKEPASYM